MQPLCLVIEDDPELGNLMRSVIKIGRGIPEIVHDGRKGMERVRDRTAPIPELFFIDLHLPGTSGEEIIQYLVNDPRYKNSIIVVITVDETWGKAIEARGIVDAVLIKPIDDLRLYHQYIDMAIERM